MTGLKAPAKGQSIKLAYSELPFNSSNATIYYARWRVKAQGASELKKLFQFNVCNKSV